MRDRRRGCPLGGRVFFVQAQLVLELKCDLLAISKMLLSRFESRFGGREALVKKEDKAERNSQRGDEEDIFHIFSKG